MVTKVSDFLLSRLREWGVDRVFGYPGDGINGLLAAWDRAGNQPVFVQVRHEEMAAFAAVGYAKFTGRVGVCTATSGPGAIHLLNGLYDAKLDHAPVVAIVGQTSRSAMGGSYHAEVDLLSLYKDVASEFTEMVTVPEQLPNVLDRAVRTALSRHAPAAIVVPSDVQELDYSAPGHASAMVPSSLGVTQPETTPGRDDLRRAADVLNRGSRVAMLIGQGARQAKDEVIAVADLLGAGVAKALLGKDVLSDDLPFVTGAIGLFGTWPSQALMAGCDTLLTIGASFPYTQFLPKFGQARAVQIDRDARIIGMRYPNEVNLVGDARATLTRLIPRLKRKRDQSWRQQVERSVTRWWKVMESQEQLAADPINPQLVFGELSRRLPDNAILAADSGSAASWYARHLKFPAGVRGSLSGSLGTMGPGVPYAIGAKFGHPDRPAIALVGDGAMQMNGLNELITIGKYWTEWDDPRLIVAVLNNRGLSQVSWETRAAESAPKFAFAQHLPDVPYAGYALSLGLGGERVEKPDDIGGAWDRALAADRPCVLEFVTDPAVPPVPPREPPQELLPESAG